MTDDTHLVSYPAGNHHGCPHEAIAHAHEYPNSGPELLEPPASEPQQ